MKPAYLVSLAGGALMAAAAFLPWLRLGNLPLPGIPDPAGYVVLGAGAVAVALSAVALVMRRDTRRALLLAGLAGLATLGAAWQRGPVVVAERAEARAAAIALVDNVAPPDVPEIRVGLGLLAGLAGAAAVTAVGLAGTLGRRR